MSSLDLILMGLGNLFRRKARTILTVLGVVIGTTSITVMISIGLGMDRQFQSQIKEFGDLTTVRVMPSYGDDGGGGQAKGQTLLNDELVARISKIPNVTLVIPYKRIQGEILYKRYTTWMEVKAIDFRYLPHMGIEYKYNNKIDPSGILVGQQFGRFYSFVSNNFKEIEVDPMTNVFEIKPQYSEGGIPHEKRKGMKVEVLDIIANKGYEYEGMVYVDINHWQQFLDRYNKRYKVKLLPIKERRNKHQYDGFDVKVNVIDNVTEVSKQIKEMGVNAWDEAQWLNQVQGTNRMIQGVLGAVGAVSLVVAAIGITNTMVMSIYERTKEIGVMKVIGAQVRDIRLLFLFEAALIGLIGGLVGIALSYGMSAGINHLAKGAAGAGDGGIFGMAGMFSESYLPLWLAAASVFFATVIGILAGLYPSIRATRLSALAAIRTE